MPDNPSPSPSPAVGGKPCVLSRPTYDRHEKATRYVERLSRTPTPRDGSSRVPWAMPAFVAKTTSSITARSGATYGTGTAKLQSDSGSALVDDGDTVTLKNMTDKTVASGAYTLVVWALGAWWVAAPGSCTNLS